MKFFLQIQDGWGSCTEFMRAYGLKPYNQEDLEEALAISRGLKGINSSSNFQLTVICQIPLSLRGALVGPGPVVPVGPVGLVGLVGPAPGGAASSELCAKNPELS